MSLTAKDQLNRPLNDLRLSVIDRCNFRCPYCMPEAEYSKNYKFLKENQWLSFDEIERLTRLFVQLGVTKVRLTGGEPLLRPNLPELVQRLNQIKGIEDLALTTNASLLEKYASSLKDAGLQRLTISLDALDTRTFKTMSGNRGNIKTVLDGIAKAEQCGFTKIKINVVIQKGVNDHAILDLVNHFKGSDHILRFIEYMDVGNCNHWNQKYVMSSKDILNLIHAHSPLEPLDSQYFGEVAKRYHYADGSGEIGFISSITQPFCSSCTRARVSADGKLFTCLFAHKGTDLRTQLREDNDDTKILALIRGLWHNREDRYSEQRKKFMAAEASNKKVEMFQIGG